MEDFQLDPSVSKVPSTPSEKSPGVAFALSLIVPGAGQIYCGKVKRGIWTLTIFIFSIAGTTFLVGNTQQQAGEFLGIFLNVSVLLYGFAFLDAFFTAREINDGIDEEVVENPRVAAILNLVTNGFGYVYLGEKRKGILLFIALGVLGLVAGTIEPQGAKVIVGLVLIGVAAALAVDAYRIGSQRSRDRVARWPRPTRPVEPAQGLSPSVPLTFAALLGAGYVGLIVLGLLLPDYTVINHSALSVAENEGEKTFANPTYGIELRVPSDWFFDQSDLRYIVAVQSPDSACHMGLVPDAWLPILSLKWTADYMAEFILDSSNHYELKERRTTTLAGLPAHELVFEVDLSGTRFLQTYIFAQSGFTLYQLITTTEGSNVDRCQADYQRIRESIVISR